MVGLTKALQILELQDFWEKMDTGRCTFDPLFLKVYHDQEKCNLKIKTYLYSNLLLNEPAFPDRQAAAVKATGAFRSRAGFFP